MCGFVGILNNSGISINDTHDLIKMLDAISHRGPDDYGTWDDKEAGIALGHRRLSIIDLSPLGHQPMKSESGRFVIAFNGEIYNYKELKKSLKEEGYQRSWKGSSDTEVLLALIEAYGVKAALEKCVGMFAFSLWDRKNRTLSLARDRLGEKPLYYTVIGKSLLFGSDLESFYKYSKWNSEISRDSIATLMKHNYIPAPYSIFENVFKVEPGTILTFQNGTKHPKTEHYWNPTEIMKEKQSNMFSGTKEEAVDIIESMIRQSLSGQMISDVPLGAFLSGGIDSSTIVSLMQSISNTPVKTFSIGFNEDQYNEATHAKAIAKHLGTDHTEFYASPQDALNVIPKLPSIYSEPFADSSQIPTFLVSQLAKKHVTVCLSGDGGDELFSGYSRYSICSSYNKMPELLKTAISSLIKVFPPDIINIALSPIIKLLPSSFEYKNLGRSLHKLADLLKLEKHEGYLRLISHWKDTNDLVYGSEQLKTKLQHLESDEFLESFIRRMMFTDMVTYLPDDILVKVDRASMAVSLESRVPFLDHRLVEFTMSLPLSILRHNNKPKWPLKQILNRYVPKNLTDRPKMGFGVPIDSWLRGPLKEWGEELINPSRLQNEGYFNKDIVTNAWQLHQSKEENQEYKIWNILMFQSWLERYKSR